MTTTAHLGRRAPLLAALVAITSTAAAALVRAALTPWLESAAPLMVFLLSVFVSASAAGLFGGVLATVLGALGGTMLFISPDGLGAIEPIDRTRIVLFVGVGLMITASSEALLRARSKLRDEVAARTEALAEREVLLARERAARENAEALARLRDEFVSTVSHELRTPVNAILGYAVLLKLRIGDDPKLAHGLDVIERNARAQARLVDDLLDLGRMLGGKLRLEARPMDLRAPVRDALDAVRVSARAKQVALEVELGAQATFVVGDPGRLQQVVWNLLSNAIKFTPAGGCVRVELERDGERARLSVSDTGEGIEEPFLPHVFERFRQQDASSTRVHGGMGIGLAIARQVVELHGGTVRAASEGRGRGARFEIVLPLADEERRSPEAGSFEEGTPVPGESGVLAGARVLLVEDDPDARAAVREGLRASGAMVDTASAAEPALALLDRKPYDVLVSDLAMPGRDGWWLVREVRRAAQPYRRIPAIALSGFARDEDRSTSADAGFDRHLAKPLDPIELAREIARTLGRPSSPPA